MREDNSNRTRIARVDRDRECTPVAIITIDIPFGLPNAVGVPSGMILKSDEEDFGPEIPVEAVLRFDNSEIVAGRNHAPIEEDEVFIAGNKDHGLSTAGKGEEQSSTKDYTDLANEIVGHRSEAFWGISVVSQSGYCCC